MLNEREWKEEEKAEEVKVKRNERWSMVKEIDGRSCAKSRTLEKRVDQAITQYAVSPSSACMCKHVCETPDKHSK